MHKLMRLLVLFFVFLSLAASLAFAQDQQKQLDDELLFQLFVSSKNSQTDKDALIKKVNSLAKENFDQQYKGNVKNVELEGVYELARNCFVTCHTAQLGNGEEVFLFHAHIFSKFENRDVQIHGHGREDMAEFGKFMMMSDSGKIKFIRSYFKTYAQIDLP